MKKILYSLLSLLLISVQGYSDNVVINGKAYSVDTVANFKAGPGTEYLAVEFKGEKRMNVFFLKVDVSNPYITYRAAVGRDSIYGGEQPTKVAARKSKDGEVYIAGTNGDFYQTSGYVGLPLSYTAIDHEIANNPSNAYHKQVFAFDEAKIPYIGEMNYSGSLRIGTSDYSIHHVNHLREANQLVLYNQHNGKFTRTTADGTEVLVQLADGETWGINKSVKAKVVTIEQNKGNMVIPQGYAILSGNGTSAQALDALSVGDEVIITLNLTINNSIASSFTDVIGGDPRQSMLLEGVPNTTEVWNELHPRTGFGYSQDKKTIYHCVVDGRSSISAGATTKELAEIMLWAGAYTALNLDGGGSSCLFLKDFGPMNKNSDGVERAVSNGIYILSTAPTDNEISEIRSLKQKVRLPRYGIYKPTFFGYNQYGLLISKDVTGATQTVDSSVGEILPDGSFFASGTQSGVVNVTFNGATTSFQVEIMPEAPVKIRLDSVLLDNKVEYPVEVQTVVDGVTMNLYSGALTWEVENPSVCSVTNGTVKGIGNGSTWVIGSLGTFKDTIKVNVEIPEERYITACSFTSIDWNITKSSNLTNVSHATTEDAIITSYTYKSGRNTNIAYHNDFPFYSLPDSFKIKFNPGGSSISKVVLRFKENNGGIVTINKEYTGFEKNKDNTIGIRLSELMNNPTDRGAYPLHFNFMQFAIDGVGMTSSQNYDISIKEFLLVYEGITTGVNNPEMLPRIKVYPNPSEKGKYNVAFYADKEGKARIEVVSVDGKLMRVQDLGTISKGDIPLPLNGLASGLYIVRVYCGSSCDTIKIITK